MFGFIKNKINEIVEAKVKEMITEDIIQKAANDAFKPIMDKLEDIHTDINGDGEKERGIKGRLDDLSDELKDAVGCILAVAERSSGVSGNVENRAAFFADKIKKEGYKNTPFEVARPQKSH